MGVAGSAGGICVVVGAAVLAPRDAGGGTDFAGGGVGGVGLAGGGVGFAGGGGVASGVAGGGEAATAATTGEGAAGAVDALLSFSYFLIISSHSAIDSNIIGLPSAVMQVTVFFFAFFSGIRLTKTRRPAPAAAASMSFLSSNSVFGASAAKVRAPRRRSWKVWRRVRNMARRRPTRA